ncbi:MAG: DUF1015 domain-containing protein [Anaerolineaceae bacterium]|nr:DUF1015 domain-containing protein [Anaerolineaceae bacterium]
MTIESKIGVKIPEILLPIKEVDLTKWAVIACDQFTSEPEYWDNVADLVGKSPSTLHMILPEVYLEKGDERDRIRNTQLKMQEYHQQGLFHKLTGLIYVERFVNGIPRKGLMVCLDLEAYDFSKGSQTLIRATEGTIIDRLPPRIRIRENALLEMPHILVLFDDPNHTVISPILENKNEFNIYYDLDLMMDSGHLTGRFIDNEDIINKVFSALERLTDPDQFTSKYDLQPGLSPLLFAMGDGNHSLATAKAIWEKNKIKLGLDHPSRYALVEIVNLHDPALTFEPIHRILFNAKPDMLDSMTKFFNDRINAIPVPDMQQMINLVNDQSSSEHAIGMITADGFTLITISNPESNLPVGSLQSFLDKYIKDNPKTKIDYVHGQEILNTVGTQPGNIGFYLAGMDKKQLFRTVILDGALPRKTFSMGEAKEKRFYMECRFIRPI